MLDCQLCWRRCIRALLTSRSMAYGYRYRPYSIAATATVSWPPPPRTFMPSGVGLKSKKSNFARPAPVTASERQAFRKGLLKSGSSISKTKGKERGKGKPVREEEGEKKGGRVPPRQTGLTSPYKPTRLIRADPARLAKHIQEQLEKDPHSRLLALETVRAATSHEGIDTIASWNQLMSHAMAIGDASGAYKTLNEMKKRRITPNAHTYTILLSGLAEPQNAKYKSTLRRAVQTYNALKEASLETRDVELSVIHTNAMLKVCARTGAMDTMWEVIGGLPESGKGAADAWTYTTFLNGLRQVMRVPDGAGEMETGADINGDAPRFPSTVRATTEDVIQDAKRLWAGVLNRWSKAKLIVDEELIGAMGRLLLSSPRESDWKEIFIMIYDIYKIPNFYLQYQEKHQKQQEQPTPPTTVPSTTYSSTSTTSTWTPPTAPKPSNATLSLLLEATAQLRLPLEVGESYWHYFTRPPTPRSSYHQFYPDLENHHSYLRLLRKTRDALKAVEFIEGMAKPFLPEYQPKKKARHPSTQGGDSVTYPGGAVVEANTPIPPTPKSFILALACTRRKGGRLSHYSSALKLLDLFDRIPPPSTYPNAPIQLKVGYKGRTEGYITRYAPKVYTTFLDLALFFEEGSRGKEKGQTLKHALKRVTTVKEDPEDAPSSGTKEGKPDSGSKGLGGLNLLTLLSSKATRSLEVISLANKILSVAQTLLDAEGVGWGHGERDALVGNVNMLSGLVKDRRSTGDMPRWRNVDRETKWEGGSASRRDEKRGERGRGERGRGKGRHREDVEVGELASDWMPSSARDRGAKKFDTAILRTMSSSKNGKREGGERREREEKKAGAGRERREDERRRLSVRSIFDEE